MSRSKGMTVQDEIAAINDLTRCAVDAATHMIEAGIQKLMITIESERRFVTVIDSTGQEHHFLPGENRHSFARAVVLGD